MQYHIIPMHIFNTMRITVNNDVCNKKGSTMTGGKQHPRSHWFKRKHSDTDNTLVQSSAASTSTATQQTAVKLVKRRPSRILFGFCIALVAAIIAITVVIGQMAATFAPFASTLPFFHNTTAAHEASQQVTEEVEAEGAVLLKNTDSTLPLKKGAKINVFGSTVDDMSYGGTGSGSGKTEQNVTFYQGLEEAGFKPNTEVHKFYTEHAEKGKDMGVVGTDFNLYEMAASKYPKDFYKNAKQYADTALVFLSRKGGEGFDLPTDMAKLQGSQAGRSYLELSPAEEDLIANVEANFDHIAVVINSPNAMKLDFLNNNKIGAALWIGTPGSTGNRAVGKILSGTVNPSGRTTDTFAYDLKSAPSYYNFGEHSFTNVSYKNKALFAGSGDAKSGENPYYWVDYQEGIYVGYRYYETAAADGFINYDASVQYPFGYGLSYTKFAQEFTQFDASGDTIIANVKVTNTGKVAGKTVVQLYSSAPYTKGGIEKPAVVLSDFAKTKNLKPGESQTIKLSITKSDLASYDYAKIKSSGAYVLEGGTYTISLRDNSHDVIAEHTFNVDRDYIYDEAHDGARPGDYTVATNHFDDVSYGDGITYLSRADWAGTFPKEVAPNSKKATDVQVAALTAEPKIENANVKDITTDAKNGLKLKDMKNAKYDDPRWEQLLDQMSVDEMIHMVSNGGWMNPGVKSIGKPTVIDSDGPNGVNLILNPLASGTQLNGQAVLGQTWNTELAARFGKALADEARAMGIGGVYAPAVNTHRSPFGGRNYEYFSEDGVLAGKLVASEVKGIRDNGVYAYVKHFAVNDQETHRADGGLVTYFNEQALREIYLKPFEYAVKDGETTGMMSSYNRLGTTPVAESKALLTDVLRGEWGFKGAVITDCIMATYTTDPNIALRAGNDFFLTFSEDAFMTKDTKETPAGHQALRQASKNILYMVANSDAYDIAYKGPSILTMALVLVDVIVFIPFGFYFWRRHKKLKRWKAQQTAQQ